MPNIPHHAVDRAAAILCTSTTRPGCSDYPSRSGAEPPPRSSGAAHRARRVRAAGRPCRAPAAAGPAALPPAPPPAASRCAGGPRRPATGPPRAVLHVRHRRARPRHQPEGRRARPGGPARLSAAQGHAEHAGAAARTSDSPTRCTCCRSGSPARPAKPRPRIWPPGRRPRSVLRARRGRERAARAADLERRPGSHGHQDLRVPARPLRHRSRLRRAATTAPRRASSRPTRRSCATGTRRRAPISTSRPTAFKGPAIYDGTKYRKLKVENDERQQVRPRPSPTAGSPRCSIISSAAIVPPPDEPYKYHAAGAQGDEYLLAATGPIDECRRAARLSFAKSCSSARSCRRSSRPPAPSCERTADYGKLRVLAQPLFAAAELGPRRHRQLGLVDHHRHALIKLIFYPLSQASGRSMAKMRAVAPRMKQIQETYKDDREKLGRAMMELYKREKINPLGRLPADGGPDSVLHRVLLGAAGERGDAPGAVPAVDQRSVRARSVLRAAAADGRRDVRAVQAESGAARSDAGEDDAVHAAGDDRHDGLVLPPAWCSTG